MKHHTFWFYNFLFFCKIKDERLCYYGKLHKENITMKTNRRRTYLLGLSLSLVFTMGCGLVSQITDKVGEAASEAVENALESVDENLDVEEIAG